MPYAVEFCVFEMCGSLLDQKFIRRLNSYMGLMHVYFPMRWLVFIYLLLLRFIRILFVKELDEAYLCFGLTGWDVIC